MLDSVDGPVLDHIALVGLAEPVVSHERCAGDPGLLGAFAVQKLQVAADLSQLPRHRGQIRPREHDIAPAAAWEQPLEDLFIGQVWSLTSSQLRQMESAASRTPATLSRKMPWVDAMARPDQPSARSWSVRFVLILRTFENSSFHHTV